MATFRAPAVVVVDLTPVLPGGENGGAKVFVTTLVRELARARPHAKLVLLTQDATHDELAVLDAPNVRRVMAVRAMQPAAGLLARGARVAAHLPASMRSAAGRIGYVLHRLSKRGSASLVKAHGGELLFCPFTAPTYAEDGVPVVCTLYDVQFHAYPQFFAPEDLAQRARAFADMAARATRIAAISEFSRASAIALGLPDATRIVAIPLRIPAPATAVEASLTEFDLERGKYLLYPANFWRHKNHEMLLAAFAIARDALPDNVMLVCTGAPGPRRDWLRDAAARMGIAARVRFPGFVPAEKLAALLHNARGLVFPSLYEGFGLPVVEAMAAGVPVACGNRTALPEVAGDAALLFDPRRPLEIAAAIVRLVADEPLRARLTAAGRERTRAFVDPAPMAQAYWALFDEAAAAVGRPH